MSTSSDVDIANIALTLLGSENITSLSAQSPQARLCNAQIDNVRKEVLRNHPWRCAKKRVTLTATSFTISSISWAADVISVETTAAHGLLVGDKIDIDDCSTTEYNADDMPILTVPSTTTFTATLDLDADPGADSDGTVQEVPIHEWQYMYRLPSDWLRYADEVGRMDFSIERRKFLCNDSAPEVTYIYDLEDYDIMDESLKNAIGARLATKICISLTGSEKRLAIVQDEYHMATSDARFNNAIESSVDTIDVSGWLDSRR